MNKIFLLLAISLITFSACNNSGNAEHEGHDLDSTAKDTATHAEATGETNIKMVAVTFSAIDPKVSAAIKEMVDHYLHIKNALFTDNGAEAASGAKSMVEAMKGLDKSLLSAEQKSAFDKSTAELKEHAAQIADNGNKIELQRSQFAMMSEEIYELVKNFGAGRPLYHDHCPMAMDNKGAMWISENKEVKNPYFGAKMPTCGTIEEVIQ
jgi:hypothetical protein